MVRERIRNPRTHRYYKLQERDGERRRGQISGLWYFEKEKQSLFYPPRRPKFWWEGLLKLFKRR